MIFLGFDIKTKKFILKVYFLRIGESPFSQPCDIGVLPTLGGSFICGPSNSRWLQTVEEVLRGGLLCCNSDRLSALQGDGAAHRPQELLLVLQAVGGAGGRTRTRPPVVRKLGHHGNLPQPCISFFFSASDRPYLKFTCTFF